MMTMMFVAYLRNTGDEADDVIAVVEDASDDTVEAAAAAATVPSFTDDESAEPEPT